jgi:hypothetical protein
LRLAHEFVERARAQKISEWRGLLQALGDGVVKERRNSRTFVGGLESKFTHLLLRYALGRSGHQVGSRLGLGIGNHLSDVFLTGEDRGEAVDAKGKTGVRWCTVLKGAEQEAEPTLGLLVTDSERSKNP